MLTYQYAQIINLVQITILKIWLVTFLIFMGLFSLAFQIGATTLVSDEDANTFVQEFLSSTQDISGFGIFVNNAHAALPMFVPGFGMVWGAYTGWSTGIGFASMAVMAPALYETTPLSILYMSPFGFMEIVAYSIAMSCSFHIILVLIKRRKLKQTIRLAAIEVGIVVVLLLIAGYLEEYMINVASM